MIKSWIRALALLFLVLTLVVTVLIAAAWTALPLDPVTLNLDGESFSVSDLQGSHVALAFVAVVAAVVLALIVGMVAVVVGLGLGGLGIAIGLLATAGSLALVVAPFALVGWLLWRLFRRRPGPAVVAGA